MTAKSRRRKLEKKIRRETHVSPQPRNPRIASAEEADRAVEIFLDGGSHLQATAYTQGEVGTDYIFEVGGEDHTQAFEGESIKYQTHRELEDFLREIDPREEVFYSAPAPDAAPVVERGASSTSGQPPSEQVIANIQKFRSDAMEEHKRAHMHSLEVDGKVFASAKCFCEIGTSHTDKI